MLSKIILKSSLAFFVGILILVVPVKGQFGFVKTKGKQLIINNKAYYFKGANYWYGGFLGLEKDKKKGIERLRKELDFLVSNGVTNLRVIAGAEGAGMINGVVRVTPSLQPEQGAFNEEILKGLDILLVEMGKRNMKAVVFFSNNWEWSGGFQQYLDWNGQVPDSLRTRKLNWDEHRDIVSKFYSCQPCKESYLKQVALVVNRTNHISRKKYLNDPAIMAWQLANEPRPMRPSANPDYQSWVSETAAYIKNLDKNHLVSIGHEGESGTESMPLYEQIHNDKNIDYLTMHIWPKNWGWFAGKDVQGGLPRVIERTAQYMQKHILAAEKLDKPLVVEEFGLPRDDHSFAINSTTHARDAYFKNMLSLWKDNTETKGVLAGFNFWSFGGAARPIPGQIFWKKGDELMGDPPMEEQGLNSVFDSDVSTWNLIKSFKHNN